MPAQAPGPLGAPRAPVHRIPRPTSERQPDCVSHITIKGTLKTHTPLRNTKYGIGKTPRRTESHDGLGLALADPRHPLTLTIQTKAKRHQSLRRLRRRTPHTCRLAASPFHTHAEPSRYWRPTETGQGQRVAIDRDPRHREVLRNRPKKRHPAGPAPGSCLSSKWRGGVRRRGETYAG